MLDEDERTRIQMSQNSQPSSSKLALQGKFSISNHHRGPWFDSDEFTLLDWTHPIRSHGLVRIKISQDKP